jgi:hypothetical protein
MYQLLTSDDRPTVKYQLPHQHRSRSVALTSRSNAITMSDIVQQPKSATTVFLDQPPSCLEFCPDIPNHFVVGTYLLSETKSESEIQQTKTGSVQLWKLDPATNEL